MNITITAAATTRTKTTIAAATTLTRISEAWKSFMLSWEIVKRKIMCCLTSQVYPNTPTIKTHTHTWPDTLTHTRTYTFYFLATLRFLYTFSLQGFLKVLYFDIKSVRLIVCLAVFLCHEGFVVEPSVQDFRSFKRYHTHTHQHTHTTTVIILLN